MHVSKILHLEGGLGQEVNLRVKLQSSHKKCFLRVYFYVFLKLWVEFGSVFIIKNYYNAHFWSVLLFDSVFMLRLLVRS